MHSLASLFNYSMHLSFQLIPSFIFQPSLTWPGFESVLYLSEVIFRIYFQFLTTSLDLAYFQGSIKCCNAILATNHSTFSTDLILYLLVELYSVVIN